MRNILKIGLLILVLSLIFISFVYGDAKKKIELDNGIEIAYSNVDTDKLSKLKHLGLLDAYKQILSDEYNSRFAEYIKEYNEELSYLNLDLDYKIKDLIPLANKYWFFVKNGGQKPPFFYNLKCKSFLKRSKFLYPYPVLLIAFILLL